MSLSQEAIRNFIANNRYFLKKQAEKSYNSNDDLAFSSYTEELYKTNIPDNVNNTNSYLKTVCKNLTRKLSKSDSEIETKLFCTYCKFLGKELSILKKDSVGFVKCGSCSQAAMNAQDPLTAAMFRRFATHHTSGYRCTSCANFIPKPLVGDEIVCLHGNCQFQSKTDSLKEIRHPFVRLEKNHFELNENIAPDFSQAQEMDYNFNYKLILSIIENQKNFVAYKSRNFTIILKQSIYESIELIAKTHKFELYNYLANSKKEGLVYPIFAEAISILEKKLPFSIIRNNSQHIIDSLYHKNLQLFDGLSNFNSEVLKNNTIKNNTLEIYTGTRNGATSKKYFIGKLIQVSLDGKDISDQVKSITFNSIEFNKSVKPNSVVNVTHYRIAPHYEMGVLMHINRILKMISKKLVILKKK